MRHTSSESFGAGVAFVVLLIFAVAIIKSEGSYGCSTTHWADVIRLLLLLGVMCFCAIILYNYYTKGR